MPTSDITSRIVFIKRYPWAFVVLFLVISRSLLNIPALLGANAFPLNEGCTETLGLQPNTLPGVWARWDSGYYLGIAAKGYSFQGDEVNFFPAYPLTIQLFSLGNTSLMGWIGFIISNLSFILAVTLLWHKVERDYNRVVAWGTIVTLSVFPTSFFFSAIYAESLFLLFSVLVYLFSERERYILSGLLVSLASLTRIYGFLLVLIPLVDVLRKKTHNLWIKLGAIIGLSGTGLILYMLYLWFTQGSPIAFVSTQRELMKRSITWPGYSFWDSFAVIVWGYGGFKENWFMRVVSLQDLLAILLFVGCTVFSFRLIKQKSLVLYMTVSVILLSISHGPYTLGVYSMSRYVLALFPGFIVLGILLEHLPRFKWLIWGFLLFILCFLTIWFGNGRWVA